MSTQAPPRERTPVGDAPRRPRSVVVLRIVGWTLLVAGVVVLLYVVYAMFFTDLAANRTQGALIERWEAEFGDLGADEDFALEPDPDVGLGQPDDSDGDDGDDADDGGDGGDRAVSLEDALAVIAFERPGADERPVNPEPLAVVDGISVSDLQRGPGHYPGSALPGEDGNFAVAGHRVTYGRPFYDLDEIRPGDEVHVWDRDGEQHVYEVTDTEIVGPRANWVLDDDPQGSGEPTLTLTTCHPRFSARQRLIVFAELVE